MSEETKGIGAIELDDLDQQVLTCLIEHGRESARKLARRLNVSPATLIARTKRLERVGIVEGYGAIVDYSRLGFEFMALIEVTITKGKLIEVQRAIAQLAGVVSVYDVTGLTDAIILARCRNRTEFSGLVKKIGALEFVERTNTHVILNVIKEDNRMQSQFNKEKNSRMRGKE